MLMEGLVLVLLLMLGKEVQEEVKEVRELIGGSTYFQNRGRRHALVEAREVGGINFLRCIHQCSC